ncbi:dTDP-4-dehydrorhamnose 3,5-epimerase [Insolitispirillum peregrinum]
MSIEVVSLAIPDVKVIKARKIGDHRGFFSETYNKKAFAEAGIDLDFVQDNHSHSSEVGTVRGLHYQAAPHAQNKLVRVLKGRILDVAVDIRRSSPTFGQWVAAEISAAEWNQILVPVGFAHGVVTLEPDTELLYKVTDYYAPSHDFGIRWNDPALGIDWPVSADTARLSAKDLAQPLFSEAIGLFD